MRDVTGTRTKQTNGSLEPRRWRASKSKSDDAAPLFVARPVDDQREGDHDDEGRKGEDDGDGDNRLGLGGCHRADAGSPAASRRPSPENGGPTEAARPNLPAALRGELRAVLARLLVQDMRTNPPDSIGDFEPSVAPPRGSNPDHKAKS